MSDFSLPRPKQRVYRSALTKSLSTQRDVLWALILHDIKSRFFGNGLGYVVTILWPATHIAIIIIAHIISKRPIPYGNSALLYASTGVLPFIAWNYMSRFTMMAVIQNRSFMAYPVIKPLDMMIARLALEHVSVFIITVGLVATNLLFQVDVVPVHLTEAVCGLFSALLLGIGFGVVYGIIGMIFPLWMILCVPIIIVCWLTSGTIFNPETMPAELGYYVSWNPVMHCVEWIRLGYYADFPAHLLSKSYVLSFGATMLAVGLILERALKRFF